MIKGGINISQEVRVAPQRPAANMTECDGSKVCAILTEIIEACVVRREFQLRHNKEARRTRANNDY